MEMKAPLLFLVIFVLAISLGEASPAKRNKSKNVKHHHEEDGSGDGDSEWPAPDDVKNFVVPPGFTEDPSEGDNESTTSAGIRHHGKSHRKQ